MRTYISEKTCHRARFGDDWILRNLTPVTILFGRNGSGKSLLLRALHETDIKNMHYVVPERIGKFVYDANSLQQQLSPEERRALATGNFNNNYRSHVVTRIQALFSIRGAIRSKELPFDLNEIEQLIQGLLPNFSISIGNATSPLQIARISSDRRFKGVEELSSGESEVLALSLDLLTIAAIWSLEQRERRILLLDEPDVHLHPDLQVRFADFVIRVAKYFELQVFIATHSTTMLAALGQFASEFTSLIYMDAENSELVAKPLTAIQKTIASCLGGHILMGPLFGAPILLVEGDDDYRVWAEVPRHNQIRLAVLPCNGDEIKKYQNSLEQIFKSLNDPSDQPFAYALLDGDKTCPSPSSSNPQKFAKYIKLACHEAENLYLTDEVLADIPLDWSAACEKIVSDAYNYGNKAELLKNAPNWDRKKDDIKTLINEISGILDPKKVHWTSRVGKCLGRNRPEGQLYEFLGSEVVKALWRN